MHDFIRQIEKASDVGLYFVALNSALTVPDVCGALESENGWAHASKYAAWFDRWVAPRYAFFGGTSLSGEICYSYRCAVLHQGRSARPNMPYQRVLFIEPGNSGIRAHNNVINDALNIDVQTFCADVVAGCRAWLATVEGSQPYESHWAKSMQRHPKGLAPYIVGVPVIG
jgi:hypothetical protein